MLPVLLDQFACSMVKLQEVLGLCKSATLELGLMSVTTGGATLLKLKLCASSWDTQVQVRLQIDDK